MRNKIISIRFTESEYNIIQAICDENHISVSKFFHILLLSFITGGK